MLTVIIAAHDEESVLGACLDALRASADGIDLEVIVSANGCSDATARIAAEHGATVIDRPEPGKAGALNAAERAATGFPRIYLDADILVPADGIAAVLAQFEQPSAPLAVMPRRRIDVTDRPWPVRAYSAINERLPVFRDGLFGRGMIALSAEGRRRFGEFPDMIADDLFLDAQFSAAEKSEASDVVVSVESPHTTRQLIDRLVRVRRGNAEMRAAAQRGAAPKGVRRSDRWAWLRDVVLPEPRLAPAAVAYVVITLVAGLRARRAATDPQSAWGRDESTRATIARTT
ncbi:glycosyltransferase involved in cell wall biosynthesis [Microbacterium sp. ZKA21]|uniref:glycosyltransferase n=1 Tax=Microbacterium sp. ZKA21 TaxID=3381694 RepID=UPI003D1B7053